MEKFFTLHKEGGNSGESFDYKQRYKKPDLFEMRFEHIDSEQDFDVYNDAIEVYGFGVWAAGYTEWKSTSQSGLISLGWDWFVCADQRPEILSTVAPRTNLKLIEAKGYDLNDSELNGCLFELIGTLDWQVYVTSLLTKQHPLSVNRPLQ